MPRWFWLLPALAAALWWPLWPYYASDDFIAVAYAQDLHAVAHDYFGSARFREVVHAKVASVFPAHEVEVFTNHFFGLVQQWRADHPLES